METTQDNYSIFIVFRSRIVTGELSSCAVWGGNHSVLDIGKSDSDNTGTGAICFVAGKIAVYGNFAAILNDRRAVPVGKWNDSGSTIIIWTWAGYRCIIAADSIGTWWNRLYSAWIYIAADSAAGGADIAL